MSSIKIPKGYHSELNLHDTQVAIKTVKDCFQTQLSARLDLHRVSAPLKEPEEISWKMNLFPKASTVCPACAPPLLRTTMQERDSLSESIAR